MNAATARIKAITVSAKEKKKKIELNRKRQETKKRNTPILFKKRVNAIEEKFRERIEGAVRYGSRGTEYLLSENNTDQLVSLLKKDTYASGQYREGISGDYFGKAAYGKEVKLAIANLRHDGYKIALETRRVEHDESAAYMNSGGECGSETPYHTDDNILVIKW